MDMTSRPAWVADAVFYQIFPDRFARSSTAPDLDNLEPWDAPPSRFGYKGGDLDGIVQRLDWLTDLGITAIYLNPIFQSASNHRYHTHDYFTIDPMLGDDAAFDRLLTACHDRQIRVVLDGVFNHASRGFFRFNDLLESGEASPWADWFHVDSFPVNAYDESTPVNYSAWWGIHALPKLNTENPRVREYLMQVAEHWIRRGIDGWRLDVPEEIRTEGFWEEMRRRVRAINPDAYLVGEVWGKATDWVGDGTRFDGVMNYPMTEANLRFAAAHRIDPEVAEPVNLDLEVPLDAPTYATEVASHLAEYPATAHRANLNLLGSHDTARVRSLAGGDDASVMLAATLMFTFPGAPCVYYGDEIGLEGGHDPGSRAAFPWDRKDGWHAGLLDTFRSLIALRQAEPALRHGTYSTESASGELYAFSSLVGGEGVVVALNAGDSPGVTDPITGSIGDRLWGAGTVEAARLSVPARSAGAWRIHR